MSSSIRIVWSHFVDECNSTLHHLQDNTLALDFKNDGMLRKDYEKEYGKPETNGAGHTVSKINGYEVVVMGRKTVFTVRETVAQTSRLSTQVADSSTLFDANQMKHASRLLVPVHGEKCRVWEDIGSASGR